VGLLQVFRDRKAGNESPTAEMDTKKGAGGFGKSLSHDRTVPQMSKCPNYAAHKKSYVDIYSRLEETSALLASFE
jgi:hypothetical protein